MATRKRSPVPPPRPEGKASAAAAGPPPPAESTPKTEYVLVQEQKAKARRLGVQRQMDNPPGGKLRSIFASEPQQTPIPKGLPRFLGNRRIVVLCWAGAIAFISIDEWKVNGILPRPARLWDASLVYLLLAAAGAVEALVPLVNAFAIGYLLVLAYQFYGKKGQFS